MFEKREFPFTRCIVWLVVVLLAITATGTQSADAKRFDCQMFCRTTGFHGTVGGCRCSFSLFTSKRTQVTDGYFRNPLGNVDVRLPRKDNSAIFKTSLTDDSDIDEFPFNGRP